MNEIRKYMNILNEDFAASYMPSQSTMADPLGDDPTHCSDEDSNNSMSKDTLMQMMDNLTELKQILDSGIEVPSWALAKIAQAAQSLETVHNYMAYSHPTNEDLL